MFVSSFTLGTGMSVLISWEMVADVIVRCSFSLETDVSPVSGRWEPCNIYEQAISEGYTSHAVLLIDFNFAAVVLAGKSGGSIH